MRRIMVCIGLGLCLSGCTFPPDWADTIPDLSADSDTSETTGTADNPDTNRGGSETTSEDGSADSDVSPVNSPNPQPDRTTTIGRHDVALGARAVYHVVGYADPLANCTSCHGTELEGSGVIPDCPECYVPSCTDCHGAIWSTASLPSDHNLALGSDAVMHRDGLLAPADECARCHGRDLTGAGIAPSCTSCHDQVWETVNGIPVSHAELKGPAEVRHASGALEPGDNCAACHGTNLEGAGTAPSCTACHGELWGDEVPASHTRLFGDPSALHKPEIFMPERECTACHGSNLTGSGNVPACTACHGVVWTLVDGLPVSHNEPKGVDDVLHKPGLDDPNAHCTACHGFDLEGEGDAPACTACHAQIWAHRGVPDDHTLALGTPTALHKPAIFTPDTSCTACHGYELTGAGIVPSCYACHDQVWDTINGLPISHSKPKGLMGVLHKPGFDDPEVKCTACHGLDLKGAGTAPSCTACHTQIWAHVGVPADHEYGLGDPNVMHKQEMYTPQTDCTACHGYELTGAGVVPSCLACHGEVWQFSWGVPISHDEPMIGRRGAYHRAGMFEPETNCAACHGVDLQGSPIATTCYACHGRIWSSGDNWPPSHSDELINNGVRGVHPPDRSSPATDCVKCHQTDFFGTDLITSCWSCHGSIWDGPPDYPPTHTRREHGHYHASGWNSPYTNCAPCHGADLRGTSLIPSCYSCHGAEWNDD